MPQSLANVLVHLVFSTKYRRPFLRRPEHRDVMTGYLIGTLQNLRCAPVITKVLEDHVHILCNLHRTVAVAELMEDLKTSSSARIKEKHRALAGFQWQGGYGAFSVSQSRAETVKVYIHNQEEHHRTKTFQEEFRLLLKRHGIEYDERYVWE